MKRKVNESYGMQVVRLDLTAIAKDDRSVDFNDLADTFETMGADIDHDDNGHVIMVVSGLSKQKVEDILNSVVRLGAKPSYFVYDGDYMEDPEEMDYPDYDDLDESDDDFPPYEEEVFTDDMVLDEDGMAEHDEILRRCINAVQKAVNMKVIFCEDDIEDNLDTLMDDVVNDPDELSDDEYNELADILHEAWEHIDFDLGLDSEEDEMPRFQKMGRHGRLEEKRKRCCPGKTLNERLKSHNEKDQKKVNDIEKSIKDILKDFNSATVGAHEAREAFKKLKAENAKLSKIEKAEGIKFNIKDVAGVTKALKDIKKVDPEISKEVEKFQKQLSEKVNRHLKAGKGYLHENVSYKGKSFKNMSVFELKSLYDKILAEKVELSNVIKNTLNESIFNATKVKLQKKNQLLNFIDEELTYRIVRQRCLNHINEGTILNEDGGEITDEELANLFGPGQGEEEPKKKEDSKSGEENSKESGEEDEEVELSRIEITLKNMEAAQDLKQACLDADIPEDAIEIEGEEEEESDEEESDENINSEEPAEGEEEESEEANESLYYGNIRKLLFEGEVTDDPNDDGSEETPESDEDATEEEDSEDNEEESEEGVKFILTNTDYAMDLAKVLDDQYGISKEEFEEMIGGSIVEESEDSEDKDDEDATEGDGEKSEDKKEEEEEIDPADLFKGL